MPLSAISSLSFSETERKEAWGRGERRHVVNWCTIGVWRSAIIMML